MKTSMASESNGKAAVSASAFRRETSVSIRIASPREVIWTLLTSANDFPRWNSTVKSIEGKIAPGEKIRLKTTADEKRTFTLKVTTFEPHHTMVWKSGAAPFFSGVRTYTIAPAANGETIFSMTETLGGIMFPMASGSIPDFKPAFERYAADLKKEAETIMNVK